MLFQSITRFALLAPIFLFAFNSNGQKYIPPSNAPEKERAPGMKFKKLRQDSQSSTYVIVLSEGDEILSGLTEFAEKNGIFTAHFTAIGDASSTKVGWYDRSRKMFKVIPINEPAEITSLVGDITMSDGKPVVHAHINVATSDGIVHGGHLIESVIGPTLELFLTAEQTTLEKKTNPKFNSATIEIK